MKEHEESTLGVGGGEWAGQAQAETTGKLSSLRSRPKQTITDPHTLTQTLDKHEACAIHCQHYEAKYNLFQFLPGLASFAGNPLLTRLPPLLPPSWFCALLPQS